MKRRTKKVLSLLLAASMVFTMNTVAFGEEIVAEDVATDDVVTEEVVNDDVAEVTEEVGAVEEAGDVAEATLGEAELEDATLASAERYYDGLGYAKKDGDYKLQTTITYASDGDKKNPVNSVVTITNTNDPVSWNNFYAADLINTVIEGTDKPDDYLNNKEKIHVSQNSAFGTDGVDLWPADLDYQYKTIQVKEGVYLFVKYGTGWSAYVAGKDTYAGADEAPLPEVDTGNANPANAGKVAGINSEIFADFAASAAAGATTPYSATQDSIVNRIATLPITGWDGRKIAWDKDNKYTANKSMKEDLEVKAALVKYENGTVTELNGASVASVKIDVKATKKASVEAASSQTAVTAKVTDISNPAKPAELSPKVYVPEHKTIGTLPTFTFTVNCKGNDVKSYKKDVTAAVKNFKGEFGIMQAAVTVTDPTEGSAYNNEYWTTYNAKGEHWGAGKNGKATATTAPDDDDSIVGFNRVDSYVNKASGNEINRDDKDGQSIQAKIAADYMRGGYQNGTDKDDVTVGGLKVSKFNDKKATITREVTTFKNGVQGADATVTLGKKDFTLEEGTLAGEKVYALTFPEDGNYAYAMTDPATARDLSVFGYKWAFRKSPDQKNNKGKFRYGVFAESDLGFVFNAE